MKFKSVLYKNPILFLSAFLFLAFSIPLYKCNITLAVAFTVAFVFVFCAGLIYSAFVVKTTRKFVTEINRSLSGKETDSVNELPIPGLISNTYGDVLWYNESFKNTFINTENSEKINLKNLFKDIPFSSLTDESVIDIEYEDKKYTVYISRLHENNLPLLSFYFLDNTYYKNVEEEYNFSRPFVMFIMLDNIELLSRQLSDSRFALVTSGLESIIEKWLSSTNVLFKKISNGRFVVVGEKRNLEILKNDKFSVLNHIKEYEFKDTDVDATLSIGVGFGGDFTKCEEKANKALDMSLGRGGDQAVICTDDGYLYFGGMTNRMNDNSKVSPRQTSANITNLIKKYDRAFIVGHKFSDYDCVGASVGMAYFCKKNGIDASVVINSGKTLATGLPELVEKEYKNLFIEPEEAVRLCNEKCVLIVTDTHRPMLLECPEIYEKSGAQIVIDHHRKMEDYISDAEIFYHRPAQSSASEMVTELIEYSANQSRVPSVVATALLSGIVLDTKDFVLRTSGSTFEAAAFLRENGADTVAVKKLFSVKESQIVLKNRIISDAENYNGFMISHSVSDDKDIRVICSKAADDLLNIGGVKASFVLSQIGDGVNISARSLGEENVQLIMERLGGGGHSTMAAAQIKNSNINSAVEKLKSALDDYVISK